MPPAIKFRKNCECVSRPITPSKGNPKTKFKFYNALVLSRISIYSKINAEFFLVLSVCLQ